MPISLSVNVDLVDKSRFYKGKKGRYLDLILFESEGTDAEQYGDYIVKQRGEKGDKLPILGNGKYFAPKKGKQNAGRRRDEEPDDDNEW